MYRLFVMPEPLDSLCQLLPDTLDGTILTAHPATHFTGTPGQAFDIPETKADGSPIANGFGALLTISHNGKVSVEQGGKLWVKRDDIQYPWEQEQTAALDVDRFHLKDIPNTPPNPIPPGTETVGCVNHLLINMEAFFFDHIKRTKGMAANDYKQVLSAARIPMGNPPGVKPNYNNGVFGLTQQLRVVNGIPEPAGRLFLPTDRPDSLGYYASAYSPLADMPGGGLMWEFRFLEGPPYAPGPCDL